MHTPLYREVVSSAWRITRHKKSLWMFGLLAAFLGTGGALELFAKTISQIITSSVSSGANAWDIVRGIFELHWTPDTISLSFVLAALLAAIALLFITAVIVSHGALIVSASYAYKEKSFEPARMWQRAWKSFVPILSIVLFFKLLVLGAVGAAAWSLHLILRSEAPSALVVAFPLLFVAAASFIMLCSFLSMYAASFVLLEHQTVISALVRSWELFARHWLVSIEMAAVTFCASIVCSVAAVVAIAAVAVPFTIITVLSYLFLVPVLGIASIFISSLLSLMILFSAGSIFATFQTAAWVILFLRMREGRAGSKLLRLFRIIKAPYTLD